MNFDAEAVAKAALGVAEKLVSALNPLAGLVVAWADETAFAIYDQQKVKQDPVAAAELAGDRVAELVKRLRFHGI